MTPLPARKSKYISKFSTLNPQCTVANYPQGLSEIDNISFTTWGKILQTDCCGSLHVTGQRSLFWEFLSIKLYALSKHFVLYVKTNWSNNSVHKKIISNPPIHLLQKVYNQLKIPRSWILKKSKTSLFTNYLNINCHEYRKFYKY